MKKKLLLSSVLALLLAGCGTTNDYADTSVVIEPIKTKELTQNETVLLEKLSSQAREAQSFEEFRRASIKSLTPDVSEETSQEIDDEALAENSEVNSSLYSFYIKSKEDDTFDLKSLFINLKNKINTYIVNIFTPTEDEPSTQTPKINLPVENQFQAVWDEVTSDELSVLPQDEISFFKLFDGLQDLILKNAKRTLEERADIISNFDKLAHPNGICLKGVWEITQENPYSGYFKNESQALIIARASTAMSNTKRGEIRAFGLAGKLFPSMDPLTLNTTPSANFFLIDDLGGTDAEYFGDVSLSNEPSVTTTSAVLKALLYSLKVASAFQEADANPGIRQVYEISELNENNDSTIITPKWMKVEALEGETKVGVDDFREELMLNDNETIVFKISVTSEENNGTKMWQEIGTITFDESIVSKTCDHRLHFHHPKFKE